jgi:hypothetical protein
MEIPLIIRAEKPNVAASSHSARYVGRRLK